MFQFHLGKAYFESGRLTCDNVGGKANLQLKATHYNAKGIRNYLDLQMDAKENQVNTLVGWANNKERTFKADLSATTLFIQEPQEKGADRLRTVISINKSPLILNDSLWNIEPSAITIADRKINVHGFSVSNGNEYLHMKGIVSPDPADTLLLDLNRIELSNIFDILNIPALQFAGKATGKFNINDLYGRRILNTDLLIRDFSFNQVQLGLLKLFSAWDDEQMGILMEGSIYKNDSTWTDVHGYVYPVKSPERPAGLSLHFDANDINIAFLQPFMEKIASGVRGEGFGSIHLHGPFKELTVEGNAFVKNGGMGIDFLDTYYTFSDSITLEPEAIKIRNLTMYDKYQNTGTVDLTVHHRHFKEFDYQVDIRANNMLMYNASERHNPLIYGTVFGSGTAQIKGNAQVLNIDINMRNEAQTKVFLNFMSGSKAAEYDFITFVDRKKLADEMAKEDNHAVRDSIANEILSTGDDGAEMRMNFLLDITPDADIELVMDPNAGDRIKGHGAGSLQIQYGNRSDLRMYGNFTIQDGSYNFSLQQLIRKEFQIREGSMISFNGDPFNAVMDINAIYNVTANLSDLDQSLALESPRTSVPVNCVLMLNGMLRQPSISFDLELPGSNEELEQQMKSLIDTDDMMTRQIIYLLVLNKFYTPEYYAGTTSASGEFTAVASSTLSAQLSSLLNSITDKVQIGTNIRAGQDWALEGTEVEMLLSSQLLNNRLLLNGNFGYKNNATQKQVFIGEFDLEYKLTRSGDIRLKAYNHANDMYQYLKQSLTTQGVGIMFKKDFTRFGDLFRRRPRLTPLVSAPDTTRTEMPK